MSADKKTVIRSQKANDVEDYDLPRWDRDGNVVEPVKKNPLPKATQVEDVEQETIKVPTLKELEAIREEAYNEGFEQGYQNGLGQGKKEGIAAGKKEGYEFGHSEGLTAGSEVGREQALAEEREKTTQMLTVFEQVNGALKTQIEQEQEELKAALTALAVRIARQTLQDELQLKPNHIEGVVHAAIQCLPNPDQKLTLFVNPGEVAFVSTFADSHWDISADQTITVGGCKIKSGYSYVDYTLEHRFDNAVSHLVETLANFDSEKIKSPLSVEPLIKERTLNPQTEADAVDEDPVTGLDANELEQTNQGQPVAEPQAEPIDAQVNENSVDRNNETDSEALATIESSENTAQENAADGEDRLEANVEEKVEEKVEDKVDTSTETSPQQPVEMTNELADKQRLGVTPEPQEDEAPLASDTASSQAPASESRPVESQTNGEVGHEPDTTE